jgi:hypothetical protein
MILSIEHRFWKWGIFWNTLESPKIYFDRKKNRASKKLQRMRDD